MRPLSPVELLASAIATKEGYFAPLNSAGVAPPPRRNNNPGDLRASPLQRLTSGGFVRFVSPEEGVAALYHQLLLMAVRGLTIRQIITIWAPPTGADMGNDTQGYINDVATWTGLDMDTKLWDYLSAVNMYVYSQEAASGTRSK